MRFNSDCSGDILPSIRRESIVGRLTAFGVSSELLAQVPEIPRAVTAIMVYGSQARGDAVPGSDLDLLAVVSRARPSTHAGDVNISYYTHEQLDTGIGTLFGAHLKRDGHILADPSGQLSVAIQRMGDVDTDRLFARSLHLTQLFTCPQMDLPKYLTGLVREARYLLRSCLYARAIAQGSPCFSVRELAIRHSDPELTRLLASRHTDEPTLAELNACLIRLQEILGSFPTNDHGSLEATIVNEWNNPGDLLSMAFLALGITGQETDYAEVEKILL